MSQKKVAVITGAASGIGQALAVTFAREGIEVVAGFYERDPHDPQVTVDLVKEAGGNCIAVAVDVASTSSVDGLIQEAIAHFGRVDIAVANAGIVRAARFEDMTDEQWDQIINVDMTGVMRTFRSACRVMAEGGALIAISSFYGPYVGWPEHSHYSAAKAGIVGLTKALAVELAPQGIRCNVVIPGIIRTPQSLDIVNSIGEEGLGRVASGIPFGRVGHADEVAEAILYLATDRARYITGHTLTVDGGLTAHWPG